MSKKKDKKNDNKNKLKTATHERLNEAYKKQVKEHEWTFFDERKHMEELVCQRFNYMLLAFSLFVTAFATIEGRCNKVIVLIVGLLVLLPISLTVMRAYLKLDILLKIVNKLQGVKESNSSDSSLSDTSSSDSSEECYNAMWFVDKEIETRKFPMRNMVKYIGVWIPLIFIILFAIGIIALKTGFWKITM